MFALSIAHEARSGLLQEEDAAAGRSLRSRRGKLRAPTTAVRASHRRRGAAPFRPNEARRRMAGGRRRRRARLHPPRMPDGAPPPDPRLSALVVL